jgi:thiol-disulfide isomerase/thioredoxin
MQFGILGQIAPDLELDTWIDAEGAAMAPFRLENHKGKVVYLLFWQSWCPGCHTIGFPTLKKMSQHFEDDERVLFYAVQTVFEGFNDNTEDKVRTVQQKYSLRVPMAHDPGGGSEEQPSRLLPKYCTGGTPWVVIIDKRGVVRFNGFHVDEKRAIDLLEKLMEESPDE